MKGKVKRNGPIVEPQESSPLTMLESELPAPHCDLRTTAKAYIARLENDLLVCLAALRSYGPIEQVSREMLHQIRDLTIIVRNRKLKPQERRRKDLREVDLLIVDLVSTIGQKNERHRVRKHFLHAHLHEAASGVSRSGFCHERADLASCDDYLITKLPAGPKFYHCPMHRCCTKVPV